jgi:chlorobactene glucosyltransferase
MAELWPAAFAAALWIGVHVVVVVRFLDSRRLDTHAAAVPPDAPLVSVVIPARNEAANIERCLRSVLASRYAPLEVLVVDDHSTDGTGSIARRIAAEDATQQPGGASRVRVLDAPDLPDGWFGKQWACHTAAHEARGDILCFTDADTTHGPELLARSVNALRARGSALFTVAGHQEAVSFWEKAVQPFVFALLLSRYGGTEGMSRSTRPLDKIANGQYLLITRAAYRTSGGHESVRAHVAEDLRLAQTFTALGLPVHMELAQHHLTTRMYTSLGEIRRGWGKNVYAAGRDTFPLGPVTRRIFPFIFPLPSLVPLIPLGVLLLGILGILGPGALLFGSVASVVTLLFWMGVYAYARLNPLWALCFPLAALVFSAISAEAAWRGNRVSWKGRAYQSRSA